MFVPEHVTLAAELMPGSLWARRQGALPAGDPYSAARQCRDPKTRLPWHCEYFLKACRTEPRFKVPVTPCPERQCLTRPTVPFWLRVDVRSPMAVRPSHLRFGTLPGCEIGVVLPGLIINDRHRHRRPSARPEQRVKTYKSFISRRRDVFKHVRAGDETEHLALIVCHVQQVESRKAVVIRVRVIEASRQTGGERGMVAQPKARHRPVLLLLRYWAKRQSQCQQDAERDSPNPPCRTTFKAPGRLPSDGYIRIVLVLSRTNYAAPVHRCIMSCRQTFEALGLGRCDRPLV